MPSGYLHKSCAERACARSGVTPVEKDAMVLGAQGPDTLFVLGMFPLRPSSKPSELGNLLHTQRTGAFLTALCRRAKNLGAVERAFAMGFLTHYALDSTVHPYVYAHSDDAKGRYSSAVHMRLEKHWDTLYFRRDGHATGAPVIMPGVAETKAHWPKIATLLSDTIREVFPEQAEVTGELILRALSESDRANRLTHSPRGIKYGIVWALERLIGKPGMGTSQMSPRFPAKKDTENTENDPWHSPFDPEPVRTEGLAELFDAGVHRASLLLTAAGRYFSSEMDDAALSEAIGNLGYDSGMECSL